LNLKAGGGKGETAKTKSKPLGEAIYPFYTYTPGRVSERSEKRGRKTERNIKKGIISSVAGKGGL